MDLRIPPRMRNALKRPNCGSRELSLAEHLLTLNVSEARACKEREDELRKWIEYHAREKVAEYSGDKKAWQVDDGEVHHVTALSADEAIELVATDVYGGTLEEYKAEFSEVECDEMPPDVALSVIGEDGEREIKTFSEWVDSCPGVIATTTAP